MIGVKMLALAERIYLHVHGSSSQRVAEHYVGPQFEESRQS